MPGGDDWPSWTLDAVTWGQTGLPKCVRRSRGCGMVGRFPRGRERGAAAGPAPEFRLARQLLYCSLYVLGMPKPMRL